MFFLPQGAPNNSVPYLTWLARGPAESPATTVASGSVLTAYRDKVYQVLKAIRTDRQLLLLLLLRNECVELHVFTYCIGAI